MKKEQYAVVTGASLGLGRAVALNLAQRGFNTILVGLAGDDIEQVQAECCSLGPKSVVFPTDLTVGDNVSALVNWINRSYDVSVLVNNVGIGGTESFEYADPRRVVNMLRLNVMVPTMLTQQLLPNLLRQARSYVLNVSSMASFVPIGFKTTYSSSKRYLQHFTKSLSEEFAGRSVSFSVVHPGPMPTNASVKERIELQGKYGRMGMLSPDRVAQIAVDGMFASRKIIVPGAANKINRFLLRILPEAVICPLLTRQIQHEVSRN